MVAKVAMTASQAMKIVGAYRARNEGRMPRLASRADTATSVTTAHTHTQPRC